MIWLLRFTGLLAAWIVAELLKRTIYRNRYIPYTDWPNRSLAEYIGERDRLYLLHLENECGKGL